MFIGTYTAKVDDKGRLVFPAAFKRDMPSECDMRFVVKKGMYARCLEMHSYETWEKEAEKIRESLDFFNPDHDRFWRAYMRDCVVVEPDPKLGRIMIPHYLLDAVGINKEVIFLGETDTIEIWDKDEYARLPEEDFFALTKSLSKK